jgi:hypothetical protein
MSKTAATDELELKMLGAMTVYLILDRDEDIVVYRGGKMASAKQCAIIALQSTIDCLKGMMIKDDNDDFEKCWYNDQLESKIYELESQIKELHK